MADRSNHLLGEFDSQRVYVEIMAATTSASRTTGTERRWFRDKLRRSSHAQRAQFKGTGTAIVSEIYLPAGKISVFYAATVAGTSGPPVKAGLVAEPEAKVQLFTPRLMLPKLRLLSSPDAAAGGSLQGLFDVDSAEPNALFVKRLSSSGKAQVGIVITTSRFPDGELFGILVPVH
jgi:hypothetical protein